MSLYGHFNDTTPFLKEFSEKSIVYNQARSPSTHSLPSHTSIFTGLTANEHGIRNVDKVSEGVTIWEELNDNYGYSTGLFSHNPFFSDNSFGLIRGFDHKQANSKEIHDVPFQEALDPREPNTGLVGKAQACLSDEHRSKSIANGFYLLLQENHPETGIIEDTWRKYLPDMLKISTNHSASTYAGRFLQWVEQQNDQWAACINFMDAHHPYMPPSDYNRWGDQSLLGIQNKFKETGYSAEVFSESELWKVDAFESLYDGTIYYLDQQIRRIITTLEDQGELQDTAVIITSDHGEAFGETSLFDSSRRMVGHVSPVREIHPVITHIPLIYHTPGSDNGERNSDCATISQFPSTVMNLLNQDSSPSDFLPDDSVTVSDPQANQPSHMICQNESGGSVKEYIQWGSEVVGITVNDAQNICPSVSEYDNLVPELSEPVDGAINRIDSELTSEIRNRLENFGYL